MILLILRLLVAALLALTPLVTEETTVRPGEVVTEECSVNDECPPPPSELPGPSA